MRLFKGELSGASGDGLVGVWVLFQLQPSRKDPVSPSAPLYLKVGANNTRMFTQSVFLEEMFFARCLHKSSQCVAGVSIVVCVFLLIHTSSLGVSSLVWKAKRLDKKKSLKKFHFTHIHNIDPKMYG